MTARPGVCYLVGAGPGDPGLLTARALELIATADVVLYDRLIPEGALDGARPDAELIYVGKAPGRKSVPQSDTEALMVDRAGRGLSVVRLKGGDPFVFGRGAEEAETVTRAGIPFEVVPGVTSGVAAPAYAGIPITHRDDASAVAFVTGHEGPEKDDETLDWEALGRFPGTLCLYMGVGNLPAIRDRLIAAGRRAEEPAAAVERGTTPGQRTVAATLGTLPEAVEREGIEAPAMIVIGDVVARREVLDWTARRPLLGLTVVVTRARAQASGLVARLRELGARPVELPAIRIEPMWDDPEVARTLEQLADDAYELLCLTSPNGVHVLFEAMARRGLDARDLGSTAVAAIGVSTAHALESHGITPEIVPERFLAEALVEAIGQAESEGLVELSGSRVLVARAAEAREVLVEALRSAGAEVDVAAVYRTVREDPGPDALELAASADYVTFTSSSTVTNLLDVTGGELPGNPRVVSIGPITSETAREAGLVVHVEAGRHDVDGLVEALVADAAGRQAAG